MKHIVLTGGGTAGHVTPNIALIPRLTELGYRISYIGSVDGIEKRLIEELKIPYYGIASGKLRRYFDWKNFSDPFRVLKGYGQAKKLLKNLAPDLVFSKGGFVTVPVVIAAKHQHIPAIIHESDMTPGLANRLAIPSAAKVCCNFPETVQHLPADKALLTGSPIRQELLQGDAEKAQRFCGFASRKPVVMIIGGSLGAASINENIRRILPSLLPDLNVIHLCGAGKLDPSLENTEGDVQFEYIKRTGRPFCPGRPGHIQSRCKRDLRDPGPAEAQSAHPPVRQSQPRRPDTQRPLLRTPGIQHGIGRRRDHWENFIVRYTGIVSPQRNLHRRYEKK